MSARPERHLFTVDEYERMGMVGLFSEDDRVELIEGEIVETAPRGTGSGPNAYTQARQLVAGGSLTPAGLGGVTVRVTDILGPA
jgi:hypothetical protein